MAPALQFCLRSRQGPRLPNNRYCLIWAAVFAALFWIGLVLHEKKIEATQNNLKAAYISDFAQSITFPPDTFRGFKAPLIVGVIGDNPFKDLLDRDLRLPVEARNSDQRPIIVRQINRMEDVQGIQILYFTSPVDSQTVQDQLAEVKGKPMLLLGECPRFLEWGGMLRFRPVGNYLHYELNLDATLNAGLRVAPAVLSAADPIFSARASLLKQVAIHAHFPGKNLPDDHSPIRLGVLGTDPFCDALGPFLTNTFINAHPLEVRYFDTPEEVTDLQMLFLGHSRNRTLGHDLARFKGKPILTVSEHPATLSFGGMIQLYSTNRADPRDFTKQVDCLAYDIDLDAMKSVGIEADIDLQRYARPAGVSIYGEPHSAVQARASRLRDFPTWIEFPSSIAPNTKTPIVIGVLGSDPFCDRLGPILSGLGESEPLIVRYFDRPEDVNSVHVLYFGQSRDKTLEADLACIREKPILSVSQIARFADKKPGGMIRLYVIENLEGGPTDPRWSAAWDLNLDSVQAAKLDARKSTILKKAAHVISDNPKYAK